MQRAVHLGFGARHNGHRPARHRIGDKVLAVEAAALKRTKHAAAGHLAIVDRKAGNAGPYCIERAGHRTTRGL